MDAPSRDPGVRSGPTTALSRKVNAMLWRHLCLVRALAASGLLTFSMTGTSTAGEPAEPIPGADSGAQTVKVLDAEKAGTITVEVRGQGQDRVRVALRNTSSKRLNVVLPPGLVASSATGQGAAGGGAGGGGGGFQNMGLGAATNRSGGFGQFAGNRPEPGFRSIPATDTAANPGAVTVPAGQKVDIDIPAVCLNFGLPTPTPKDRFRLVDVDDFSKDARVRKALRSLATLGTSQGTAQAAMWRVCNNVPFDLMLSKGEKVVNPAEVALASRFIDALDQGSDLVDPAYVAEARVFVSIEAEGQLGKDAKRLAGAVDGLRVLGLPVRVIAAGEAPRPTGPTLHLGVSIAPGHPGETRGRIVVQSASGLGDSGWMTLGNVNFKEASAASAIDGASLARAIDHAVGSAFVTSKVAKRSSNGTTIRIENRLPFTLAGVTVKAGNSSGSPLVGLPAIGVGPGRSGLATIPASNGTIDRVELNGL